MLGISHGEPRARDSGVGLCKRDRVPPDQFDLHLRRGALPANVPGASATLALGYMAADAQGNLFSSSKLSWRASGASAVLGTGLAGVYPVNAFVPATSAKGAATPVMLRYGASQLPNGTFASPFGSNPVTIAVQ